MAEGDKVIVAELQNLRGFLVNSLETVFDKMDDQVGAIHSVLDYFKDNEKKGKTDKATATAQKSAQTAGGVDSGGGLLKGFSLKDITDNIVTLSKGLVVFAKAESMGAPKSFITFLKDLQDVITNKGSLNNPSQIHKMYNAVGNSIASMGAGLGRFAVGLMMFAVPAKLKLTDIFIKFVSEFFSPKIMGKLDAKKAAAVGKALDILATGILKFAGYLMLATLAMAIGGPGLLIIIPSIMIIFGVMSMFSKQAKTIKQGSHALKEMGLGLLFFTGSLILMRFVQPKDLLMAIGVIAVFGMFVLVLGLIGRIVGGGFKGLKDAGKSVMFLSLGLIAFTAALIFMRFVQWEDIFKSILIIGMLGLFVLVLGNSKDARDGAIAMGIIAVSMIILTFALMLFEKVSWESIGKAGVAIGGLTIALLLLGSNGKQVLIGSVALIVASISIGLLGLALNMWQGFGIANETLIQVGLAIGGLTIALLLLGSNGKQVLIGSVALIVASISIGLLGLALNMWQGFGIADETLIQVGLAIGGLTVVLIALGITGPMVLVGAFALMVVAGTIVGSLYLLGMALSKFKEVDWNEKDQKSLSLALIAIPASILAGVAAGGGPLLLLAIPILATASLAISPIINALVEYKKAGVTPDDAKSAGDMIKNFIGAVRAPIEAIGATEGIFTDGPFASGIKTIRGIGAVVSEIAAGVLAASRLEYKSLDGKIIKVTPADFETVGTNVALMITALKKPIMDIGASSKPAQSGGGLLGAMGISGLVGMFLPNDNDFRQGMLAISGLGELISGIAKGVLDFASMQFKGIDGKPVKIGMAEIAAVAFNVGMLINSLKVPIIALATESDSVTKTPWWSSVPVTTVVPKNELFRKGMDALEGLGSLISGLATGVSAFASIDIKDDKGRKINIATITANVAANVGALIDALKIPIINIGKGSTPYTKSLFGISYNSTVPNDEMLRKGMDAIGGLGNLISGLASGVNTFGSGKIKDPETGVWIPIDKVTEQMVSSFTQILNGMRGIIISYGNLDETVIENAASRMKGITGFLRSLNTSVTDATAAIMAYGKVKNFDTSLLAVSAAINTSASTIMGNGVFSNVNDINNFTKMTSGIISLANSDDKLRGVATSMKSISESLVTVFSSLNTVLSDKLDAVSGMLDKLIQIDKIDPSTLDKKIQAYRSYIELATKLSADQIKAMQEIQTAASGSMDGTFKDITAALTALSDGVKLNNTYLKKIATNTGPAGQI